MTRQRIQLPAAAMLTALALAGCEGKPLSGPPPLRLGRDECSECGMLISEERSSTALLLERDGRREHALFDDLGCMLDLERENLEGGVVVARFVHDYLTRQWVDASHATFLLADPDRLPTPMSSGLAAFADRSAAEKAQAEFGGALLDERGIAAARKSWLDRRRQAASRPGGGG